MKRRSRNPRWPDRTLVIGATICIAAAAGGFLALEFIEYPRVVELAADDPDPRNSAAHFFPATLVALGRKVVTLLLWLTGAAVSSFGAVRSSEDPRSSHLVARSAWTAVIGWILGGQM